MHGPTPDALAAVYATARDGVVSSRQAIACGLAEASVRRLVAAGVLQRPHRGVLIVVALVTDPVVTAARAALAAAPPGAVCSHLTAARLWRLPGPAEAQGRAEVIAAGLARSGRPGLVVHRHRLAHDDVTAVAGVPTTTPLRTLSDLATSRPLPEAVCAVEAAVRAGLATIDDIRAAATTAPKLAHVFEHVDVRSESPLESRVRLRIVAGDLPAPESQIEVCAEDGRAWARLDLGYRRYLIAIECDGREPHEQPAAVLADRRRQNALVSAGWLLLRFTWYDAVHRPGYLVAAVKQALIARGWRPA